MDELDELFAAHDLRRAESVAPIQAPTQIQQPTQIVLQAAPASAAGSRLWLYVVLAFVLILLTYVSVQYAKDIKSRDTRNRRYNLEAYVEYGLALANRLPKGHADKVTVTTQQQDPEDSESEPSSYESEESERSAVSTPTKRVQ